MSTSPENREMRAEDSTQLSKRERGKLAQREYRKRHASRFQTLKDENLRLKNAIRKIRQSASRDRNLGPEFFDALSEAVEAAGLGDTVQKKSGRVSDQDAVLASSADTAVASMRDGQPSSGLSQPIWLNTDRLVRIYDAPADVLPYLGEGLFTFAGCLYWACTYYAVSIWKKIKKLPQPSYSYQSKLDRMFNHSKHLNDHEYLLAMAQARIEFRKKGFVDRLYEEDYATENATLAGYHNLVKREYEERNEALQWWRKPQEVESYLRPLLTADENSQLQEIVEGRGSAEAFETFASLFETLAQSFVCFGDGPRWNLIHVSMTVGAWLKHRREQHGDLEFPNSDN
ncbi:hypothetical protein B0T10DRAFT_604283 [Thelonectria olida]|uniref:BZIP domain-containing protein n=1 Tax=Thelonectria olida TaxID=1576542 RepID=A0A9P8W882_9HYPO|nr:hypothetical protein B0T10DRAFT_604283 [Thelonectria olida]